jgi:hypothetical protein
MLVRPQRVMRFCGSLLRGTLGRGMRFAASPHDRSRAGETAAELPLIAKGMKSIRAAPPESEGCRILDYPSARIGIAGRYPLTANLFPWRDAALHAQHSVASVIQAVTMPFFPN